MQRYIINRVFQAIIALLILSMVIFALGWLTGDPVALLLPPGATAEAEETLRRSLRLDQPWPVQYWEFVSSAVMLDFGESIKVGRR